MKVQLTGKLRQSLDAARRKAGLPALSDAAVIATKTCLVNARWMLRNGWGEPVYFEQFQPDDPIWPLIEASAEVEV